MEYHQLIQYMKELKNFFHKKYDIDFILGNIYRGSPDYSYFSLTTHTLKKQKLKFVIVFNHDLMQFEICLSGQNKDIRKKYWKMFIESSWDKYQVAKSIEKNLMIVTHTLIRKADFSNTKQLTAQIESESLLFINEIKGILE